MLIYKWLQRNISAYYKLYISVNNLGTQDNFLANFVIDLVFC